MKNELTAKRLSAALNNANMRPQELSDLSGVSKSSISQYINGSHAPSNLSSGKMAKVLNVNPLWLMGFDVSVDYVSFDDSDNKLLIETQKVNKDQLSNRLLSYYSALSKLSEKQQDKIFTIIDELTDFELDKNKDPSNNDSSE